MQASQANDTTVLPRAIVRRSAAIQARIDARHAESKTDPADPNAPQVPPVAATPADPAPPVVPPVPAAPAADPRENDPAYWRQRFNVTAGVLKAERTERQATTTEFQRQITELQEQVRTLQANKPPGETDLDVTQFFTPEQVEQFGEDQCKAMALAATKSAQAAVQTAIEKEVKPLREQEQRREARTVEERKQEFTDKLTELVPNYLEIDQSEDWREWLAQEDEASGLQRQVILSNHTHVLNAQKVARMFSDFLKTKTKPAPPVVGKGNGAGPSGEPPPAASPAAARAPTDAEVKDFYKRAALGRVKDTERVEFEARMKLRAAAR
jgi:hypothetical protein